MSPQRAASHRRRWSADVTRRSHALDLEPGVFNKRSARAIALSLKRSAEHSRRRKARPFASAMSMLNLYMNRAGDTLSGAQRTRLRRAKEELRALFGRAGVGSRRPRAGRRVKKAAVAE